MQFGWQGAYTQMGWFFTKAALLTFGGAYAVLPYVYQGAVEHYHWLTPLQMMDGLALGETTPGPLIMVVAFVGFVGGWSQALFGPDALFLAAASAATVVAFFTFLPSFIFIFLGRAAGGEHPRRLEIHRAADRHHCGSGRRNTQPGGVLRLSRAVAARVQGVFRVVFRAAWNGGIDRAIALSRGHYSGDFGMWHGRTGLPAGNVMNQTPDWNREALLAIAPVRAAAPGTRQTRSDWFPYTARMQRAAGNLPVAGHGTERSAVAIRAAAMRQVAV